MTYTTLKKPLDIKPLSTVVDSEPQKSFSNKNVTKIVFIPAGLTPLDVYEAELLAAGYSKKSVKETIEGLKDSPLYEGKAT